MKPLDGAPKEKRRTRKFKHELIKDGWGELQDHHGADVRIETTNIPQLLIDGEQGVVDWEQLSPPIGEAQDHPDQPMGSLIPREHKIPTFWNPTATKEHPIDRPSFDNQVAIPTRDATATRISNRGSSCERAGVLSSLSKMTGINIDEALRMAGEDVEHLDVGVWHDEDVHSNVQAVPTVCGMFEGPTNCVSMTPSSEKNEKLAMRKQRGDDEVPGPSMNSENKLRNKLNNEDNECVFKRGGRCTTHDCMSKKYVENKQVWTKKKNGMHGWVTRKQTKYVCQFTGGAKSNIENGVDRVGSQTKNQVLGRDESFTGNTWPSGLVGMGL